MKQLIRIRLTDIFNALILYNPDTNKCCIISADSTKSHEERCKKAMQQGRMIDRECDIDINLRNYVFEVLAEC